MPGNAELGEAFLPNANPSAGDLGWALSRLLVSALCLSCIIHVTLLVHLHTYNNTVISHAFRNLERIHFPQFSVSLCIKIPQKNCKHTVSKSFPVLSEACSVQVFTIIPPLKLCSSRLLLNPMDSSHLIRPNLSSIWTNRSHRCPHKTSSSSSRASAALGFLLLSLAAFSFLFFLNVCIYFGCTEY